MVRYVLKQNKNEESKVFGKWFAYPLIEETLNLDSLAEHMSNHNSDLAIFSLGIKNKKGGATSEDEFSISKNIDGVKLRARATGILVAKALNLEATLKKATAVTGKQTTGTGGETGEEDPSSSSNSGSGYPPVINP